MDKYISDLLELIKAHPELPIVPMVDSEIVCDDAVSYTHLRAHET